MIVQGVLILGKGLAGGWRQSGLFGLGRLVAQGEASRHDNLGASSNLYRLYRFPHSCKTEGGTRPCELGVQVNGERWLAKSYPEVWVELQFVRGLRKRPRSGVPRQPGASASGGSSLGRRLEHKH